CLYPQSSHYRFSKRWFNKLPIVWQLTSKP
ncbi:MAG: hypothetical protein ACI9G5_002896, partial [Paracoccaceae bacterium]